MAIIISKKGSPTADIVNRSDFAEERNLQEYVSLHPEAIPLYEIGENKRLFVAIRELPTESGPIDAFGVDKDGDIYVIETKHCRGTGA